MAMARSFAGLRLPPSPPAPRTLLLPRNPILGTRFRFPPCCHRGSLAACGAAASQSAPAPAETSSSTEANVDEDVELSSRVVSVGSPSSPTLVAGPLRAGLGDRTFFLLAFIAVTTSTAFASLVVATIPTLFAMRKAATSLAKLADTAREELPSTMAAVRLSGMEISDLTLELSDLSQEITDGLTKSTQAVQAAEAGIRKIGALARHQTIAIIEERANLPNISIQPVIAGAARKTSHVVGQAKKSIMNLFSGDVKEDREQLSDRLES